MRFVSITSKLKRDRRESRYNVGLPLTEADVAFSPLPARAKRDARVRLPPVAADVLAKLPVVSTLRKAKRSDHNIVDEEALANEKAATPKRYRTWVVVLAYAALAACALVAAVAAVRSLAGDAADAFVADAPAGAALREATVKFRAAAAAHDGIRGADFVAGTAALAPFLSALGMGLESMVRVNVVKLEKRGAAAPGAPSLERLVADEREAGEDDRDDSVAVAALWNGRILRMCEQLVVEMLAPPAIAGDARSVADVAAAAYGATLQQHHSWALRGGARALLRLAPDRRTLLERRLGYAVEEWDGRLREDLDAFRESVATLLDRLRLLFASDGHVV